MGVLLSGFLICVLIIISAFFSISEIALAAAHKLKLEQLSADGDKRAQLVLQLQEQPGHFFTVVQIGVNAAAIIAGTIAEQQFSPQLTSFFGQWMSYDSAYTLGLILAVICMTSLFVLLADLIPKRIGMVLPEKIAIRVARPIHVSLQVLKPFIWFFNGLANLFFSIFRLPAKRFHEVTIEDIVAIASAGNEAGILEDNEQQLIENILELEERTTPSSMTPRESIVWLDRQESQESMKAKIIANPHAKYPVCDGGIDKVIGYVDAKDILSHMLSGEMFSTSATSLLRNILMLPETLMLSETLKQFKNSKESFALILNEYALVVGLITLNDVTNTLMGDLISPQIEEQIIQRDPNSWLIDGTTPIDDVMRALEISAFPEDEHFETIAGFLMYTLRKVPKRTDFVVHDGFKFEVVDIDNYKIDQILVTRVSELPANSTKPGI